MPLVGELNSTFLAEELCSTIQLIDPFLVFMNLTVIHLNCLQVTLATLVLALLSLQVVGALPALVVAAMLVLFVAAGQLIGTGSQLAAGCVSDGYDLVRGHVVFGAVPEHPTEAGDPITIVLDCKLFLGLKHISTNCRNLNIIGRTGKWGRLRQESPLRVGFYWERY